MTAHDAVLFDLDGVLVDSRAAISRCINHALDAHGLPEHAPASLHRFIGPPLPAVFAELIGQPADSAVVLSCIKAYLARYATASLSDTTVIAGMPDTLAELACSYRLAVATSKSLAFADPLLAALGLREHFDVIAGPDLNAHGEEKAVTIRRALSMLDVDRAVMVGDRKYDIAAAREHDIPCIGVLWGVGSEKELLTAGADALAHSPAELAGLLTPSPS